MESYMFEMLEQLKINEINSRSYNMQEYLTSKFNAIMTLEDLQEWEDLVQEWVDAEGLDSEEVVSILTRDKPIDYQEMLKDYS
jgi:hypothetical protein